MKNRIAVALLLVASALQAAAAPEQRTRVGRAFDAVSGKFLYEERHLQTVDGTTLVADRVRYVDAEGRGFAEKQVDFSGDGLVPEFRLEDRRHGHFEAVRRVSPSEIEVRFREHDGDRMSEARIALPENALADAGFDRLIEKRWDALLDGTTLVRSFLVPSRLEFLEFRVRRIDDGAESGLVSFALEIDSAFLRLIVPRTVAVYDRKTRRLVRYEGLSNLLDDGGDNHRVHIEFEYGGPIAGRAD